jgi:hypothetical protein
MKTAEVREYQIKFYEKFVECGSRCIELKKERERLQKEPEGSMVWDRAATAANVARLFRANLLAANPEAPPVATPEPKR